MVHNDATLGGDSAVFMRREEKRPVQSSKDKDEKVDREHAETAALQDSLAASNEKCQELQHVLSLTNERYVR